MTQKIVFAQGCVQVLVGRINKTPACSVHRFTLDMRHYENAIAHVIAAYVWFAWEIPKQSLQQDDIMSHYSSVVEPTNIRLQVRRPTVTHCTTTMPSWKRDHKMTKLATCHFCAHTTCYWTSCIVTVKVLQSSPYSATAIEHRQVLISLSQALKIIGKEFQKIVLRRYLERSIQKKFFPSYTHYK